MRFQREQFTDKLFEEILPLARLHYDEIAAFKDIPLDPDIEAYRRLDASGALFLFTARDEADGSLVGYSSLTVFYSTHSRKNLQAIQDVIFIHPEKRGHGRAFILFCEANLRAAGVELVYIHVNAEHDFGHMLEDIDYKLLEYNFVKRLGGQR